MLKTLLEQINPLLFLCKFTGFQTFILQEEPQKWKNVGVVFLQVPILCFYLYAHGYSFDRNDDFVSDEYFKSGDFTATFTGMHNVLVKRIYYFWYRNSLKDILMTINKLDSTIYHTTYKTMHKELFTFVIFLIFIFTTDLFLFKPYNDVTFLLFMIGYSLPNYFEFIETFFIAKILVSIRMKFKYINDQLKIKVQSVNLKKLFPEQKSDMLDKLQIEENKARMRFIQDLLREHYNLTMLANRMNDFFGIPTLLTLGYNFIGIIVNVYYVLYMMKREITNDQIMDLINFLIWSATLFGQTWLIAKIWVNVENEANKASMYIHATWNKHIEAHGKIRDVRYLQLGSAQLLYTKVQFTAHGFFPLNMELLRMVAAAVTTYVVILIQFDL